MRKSKRTVIILIFSLLLFAGTVGVLVSMMQIDKQTEQTTTDYSATVSEIQVTNTGHSTSVQVQTKEYDSRLLISTNICENIDIDDINDLQNGQKIFFRIENSKVSQMNIVEFVDIVSLKTENHDIFTLDNYNQYCKQSAFPASIAGMIMVLLLLSIAVFCAFSMLREVRHPK